MNKKDIEKEFVKLSSNDYSLLDETGNFLQNSALGGFKAAINKIRLTKLQQVLVGMFSGVLLGFGMTVCILLVVALPTKLQNGVGTLLFALCFASIMTLIVFCGGGLYTSHIVATIPMLKKVVNFRDYFTGLTLVLLGNALGTLAFICLFYLAGGTTVSMGSDRVQTVFERAYELLMLKLYSIFDRTNHEIVLNAKTISITILFTFFSAILCNVMVTSTIFYANASKSMSVVIVTTFIPILFFAFVGYQHSPANTYFIWMMIIENIIHSVKNINISGGESWNHIWIFLLFCWLPSLVGNWIGGAFSWAALMYFVDKKRMDLLFLLERKNTLEKLLQKTEK